jgi:hypothetical protein
MKSNLTPRSKRILGMFKEGLPPQQDVDSYLGYLLRAAFGNAQLDDFALGAYQRGISIHELGEIVTRVREGRDPDEIPSLLIATLEDYLLGVERTFDLTLTYRHCKSQTIRERGRSQEEAERRAKERVSRGEILFQPEDTGVWISEVKEVDEGGNEGKKEGEIEETEDQPGS